MGAPLLRAAMCVPMYLFELHLSLRSCLLIYRSNIMQSFKKFVRAAYRFRNLETKVLSKKVGLTYRPTERPWLIDRVQTKETTISKNRVGQKEAHRYVIKLWLYRKKDLVRFLK